jgi:hypothetical protein
MNQQTKPKTIIYYIIETITGKEENNINSMGG